MRTLGRQLAPALTANESGAHLPPSPVQVGGHVPEWRAARQALQTAVAQDLAALQRAWEQDEGRARPHGWGSSSLPPSLPSGQG